MNDTARRANGATAEQLGRIFDAVEHMGFELDGQDKGLVIEMTSAMLTDVMNNGELAPMIDYVKRYCDVVDTDEDRERIAADIS